MRAPIPSPPPRSSPRSRAIATCACSPRPSPATAGRPMSATRGRSILPPSIGSGRRRTTAGASRRSCACSSLGCRWKSPERPRTFCVLKLYYAPHTCALATHIVLEEAGTDYSTVRIDFAKTEQRSPEYLKVNPKGRVPALVTDRGVLTETPAMLAFVAQSFPAAGLAPFDDAFAFAEVQAFNSYLCSTLHVAHSHRMRGHRWADDEAA